MTRTLAILLLSALSCIAQPLSMHDPSFLQSCSTLRRGLIGYWRLEESSGTRYDCSATGATLSSVNTVGSSAGKVGNCATFVAASQQRLNASSASLYNFNSNSTFSIAAWARITNNSQNQAFCGKWATNCGYHFITPNTGTKTMSFNIQGVSSTISAQYTNGVADGVYRLFAVTYNGSGSSSGLSMFVNGSTNSVVISGTSASTITNNSVFTIGDRNTSASIPYNGAVDELGIWNRVLSAAEINYLYNAGLGTHFPWAHP